MGAVCYWTPRSSASVHEWEDACGFDLAAGRAAVADGASSSFAAQRWARALVEAFLDEPPRTLDPEAFAEWVGAVAETWSGTFDAEAIDGDEWYVGEAAARGSFATFCGVQWNDLGDGEVRWRCFAVGDACLFHVRRGRLLVSFPHSHPDSFDDEPDLLSTNRYGTERGARHLRVVTGTARVGDQLLLASDALAAWVLRRAALVGDGWEVLGALDHQGFRWLVDTERARGAMADDDTTLVRWVVGAS
ncbi:MAG: protein phosphatase 2C domain-containing protein [Acidimicrobiia bacterium]|nr:protein phosphatase 2C domain-containing protein [Acidimicrobiia bacterium]